MSKSVFSCLGVCIKIMKTLLTRLLKVVLALFIQQLYLRFILFYWFFCAFKPRPWTFCFQNVRLITYLGVWLFERFNITVCAEHIPFVEDTHSLPKVVLGLWMTERTWSCKYFLWSDLCYKIIVKLHEIGKCDF